MQFLRRALYARSDNDAIRLLANNDGGYGHTVALTLIMPGYKLMLVKCFLFPHILHFPIPFYSSLL
jgi:hypothetical protein